MTCNLFVNSARELIDFQANYP